MRRRKVYVRESSIVEFRDLLEGRLDVLIKALQEHCREHPPEPFWREWSEEALETIEDVIGWLDDVLEEGGVTDAGHTAEV